MTRFAVSFRVPHEISLAAVAAAIRRPFVNPEECYWKFIRFEEFGRPEAWTCTVFAPTQQEQVTPPLPGLKVQLAGPGHPIIEETLSHDNIQSLLALQQELSAHASPHSRLA